MPAYDGESFQAICRIVEGVRQRLMHDVDKHRAELGADIADRAMVDAVASRLGIDQFESDCELTWG